MFEHHDTESVWQFIQHQREIGRHIPRGISWEDACILYERHCMKMMASAIGGAILLLLLGVVLLRII